MQIGVNWISPPTLPIIQELLRQGQVDFCEIMVDNFIHLPPDEIKKALPDVPVSFHIVGSRFLEKSPDELKIMAHHLRHWIDELKPLYVSDHVVQFTENGTRLPFLAELDYEKDYHTIKNRISLWQALLAMPILFENHASITASGAMQAKFYERLQQDLDINLLFDFSNAYIAEYNQVCPVASWDSLIRKTKHFHVAGFKIENSTQLAIDTHDAPVANEVLTIIKKYAEFTQQKNQTIVIEFDANVTIEQWKDEIERIRPIRCESYE